MNTLNTETIYGLIEPKFGGGRAAAVALAAIMIMRIISGYIAHAAVNGPRSNPPGKAGVQLDAPEKNAGGAQVEIVDFSPASGSFRRGEKAVSGLRVKNAGDGAREVWVGYSVRDAGGAWHDAECSGPVKIAAGSISDAVRIAWAVPEEKNFTGGQFTVRMAVWSARPGTPGAERLAMAEKAAAFYAASALSEKKILISGTAFRVTPENAKPQGNRGLLVRANAVAARSGGAEIRHNRGSFDGGEIESVECFSAGAFSASVKSGAPAVINADGVPIPVPAAGAKCVTGFFLFDPVTEDEVTVEIFNDGSRRVWFSAFCAGKRTAHYPALLDFDPSADYHDYAIVYSPGKAVFKVDSKIMCALPRDGEKVPGSRRMKVFFNSWFPSWKEFHPLLPGDAPLVDLSTHIRNFKFSRRARGGGIK